MKSPEPMTSRVSSGHNLRCRLAAWWNGWAAALLVGMLGVFAVATEARAQLRVGEAMPALADFGLEGDGASAPTVGRVVVLDFWASWCAPCKASFPMLGALQREWGAEGVTVIGVSVDEKKSAYDGFLSRLKPPFVTAWDAQQRLVKRVRVPKMPTTYIVDRRGVVRFIHEGFHGDSTERRLRAHVRQLLEEGR